MLRCLAQALGAAGWWKQPALSSHSKGKRSTGLAARVSSAPWGQLQGQVGARAVRQEGAAVAPPGLKQQWGQPGQGKGTEQDARPLQ